MKEEIKVRIRKDCNFVSVIKRERNKSDDVIKSKNKDEGKNRNEYIKIMCINVRGRLW